MPSRMPELIRLKDRLLDLVPMALSLQAADLNILWANRPAQERVGKEATELIGRRCHDAVYGRSSPCPDCIVLQAMADGKPRQGRVTAPDGRIWQVTADPLLDEAGEVIGAFEMAIDVTRSLDRERRRQDLVEDLQHQLAEIKTLKGLLPICAVCHKIRDDEGYWNRLEGYIQEHTDARFSHGLCPQCLQEQYLDDGYPDPLP